MAKRMKRYVAMVEYVNADGSTYETTVCDRGRTHTAREMKIAQPTIDAVYAGQIRSGRAKRTFWRSTDELEQYDSQSATALGKLLVGGL